MYEKRIIDCWAPCAHTQEEREALAGTGYFTSLDLEELFWEINEVGGVPKLYSDMWVLIRTEGYIYFPGDAPYEERRVPIETRVQGDTFLLAATQTLYEWAKLYEEIAQEKYQPLIEKCSLKGMNFVHDD